MKPITFWLTLLAGIAGCGYKAKIEYAGADHQLVQADNTSHQRTSQHDFNSKSLRISTQNGPQGRPTWHGSPPQSNR